jgi:hypothetical protein
MSYFKKFALVEHFTKNETLNQGLKLYSSDLSQAISPARLSFFIIYIHKLQHQ